MAFEHAPPRDFDLVVGADGLHSRLRDLSFGPIEQFEKDLGLRVAAFELQGYRPRDEDIAISYSEPGRQVMRFSKRDDKTLILFTFRSRFESEFPRTNGEQKATLERTFGDAGWECPQILKAMRDVDGIYYDRVSQILMDCWTKGRTALIGDAAACVSLLAGEGTGLAMAEAYVLAGEIRRAAGDHPTAFTSYEQRLQPFLARKQASALKVAASFVPDTGLGILFRNGITKLLPDRLAAKLGLGELVEDIELPAYAEDHLRTGKGTR